MKNTLKMKWRGPEEEASYDTWFYGPGRNIGQVYFSVERNCWYAILGSYTTGSDSKKKFDSEEEAREYVEQNWFMELFP